MKLSIEIANQITILVGYTVAFYSYLAICHGTETIYIRVMKHYNIKVTCKIRTAVFTLGYGSSSNCGRLV